MAGKRIRTELSDSDSDSGLLSTPTPDHAMDDRRSSNLPGSDLGSSRSTAPGNDLRPSSGHSRQTDPRPNLADDTARSPNEPYLCSAGSYVVVKPCDEGVSFRSINVFWPQKQIAAICGADAQVEIEAPANGTLVIKTNSRKATKALLKTTNFCNKQVSVTLHTSRNTSKGTVFAPELRHMTEEEIQADLRGDGVTHIRRITSFRDGQRRDTSLLVLTFDSTTLPDKINIGWLRKDVRVFIPNPLRCFKCQRFGHGSSSCRQTARCQRCGDSPHDGSECKTPLKCLSCGSEDHSVSSTQCPIWKKEKSICELKATSGMSYPEARRQFNAQNKTPTPGTSYAQAVRTSTASSSTQTEPLAALPPLKLLTPLKPSTVKTTDSTSTVTTATVSTQDFMMEIAGEDESPKTQPSSSDVPSSPVLNHKHAATTGRAAGWQVVRGRPARPARGRPDGTGKLAPGQIPPPPPSPRPTTGRPAVCVAGGRSRSQSLGRFSSRTVESRESKVASKIVESIWGPPDKAGPSKSS